jgi:surface protein
MNQYFKIFTLLSVLILTACGGSSSSGGDSNSDSSGGNDNPAVSEPFITTWKTNNSGDSEDNQITISTATSNQNYTVDWGDNSEDTGVTGDITHTYASAGTYTVTISGDFKNIQFTGGYSPYEDSQKLLSIEQWGDTQWTTMDKAFKGCENLVINATDTPDLSNVTNLSQMFAYASDLNTDIGDWDISSVKDMRLMFYFASSFNQDLNDWDVSSVTNMNSMFFEATSFNQDLSEWEVQNVTDMMQMFKRAENFNGDISQWDVSSVTSMTGMFFQADSFNQNLSAWDVSSVSYMKIMFDDIALSTTNYDALLNGWAAQIVQDDVIFSAGNSLYSTNAETARSALVNTYGWTITDGGAE